MKTTKRKSEYKTFETFAGRLFAVPHKELKIKLDAEKKAKEQKKSKKTE